jgi:aryl-alcohol dehydrogenase-like predicted oxidoreductase
MPMKLNPIPNSDLKVSPLCLGTMTYGTPVKESDAIELTHWAIDHGINFIDTANMYEGYTRTIGSAGGVSEEILGKALKGKRAQIVLATKVGMKIGPNDDDEGLSRAHVLREIDRSLKRLQSDHVDLYYMHKPDPNTPIAESVEVFNDLITVGKVLYWGISNFSAAQISELLQVCDENGWHRPVILQPPYSLLKRDIEADILPFCEKEQIAVAPYQVLQGGLLTGKYQRGEEPAQDSRQAQKPEWTMALNDDMFDQLEMIQADAKAKDRTLMQHALLSLLEQPSVVSLVVGVKRIDQIENLLQAVN